MTKYRPKRNYAPPLPAPARRIGSNGWHGLWNYFFLISSLAVPQAFLMWRWSMAKDKAVFVLLSVAYLILFGIFCVIARPWKGRGML